jgi:hypothetical protein
MEPGLACGPFSLGNPAGSSSRFNYESWCEWLQRSDRGFRKAKRCLSSTIICVRSFTIRFSLESYGKILLVAWPQSLRKTFERIKRRPATT